MNNGSGRTADTSFVLFKVKSSSAIIQIDKQFHFIEYTKKFRYKNVVKQTNFRMNVLFLHHNQFELSITLIHILLLSFYPAGKISEKAMRRSVFLTIWHRILNADSTKTPSSIVTFSRFFRLGSFFFERSDMLPSNE